MSISYFPTPDDLPQLLRNEDFEAAIEAFGHVKVKMAFADIDFQQGGLAHPMETIVSGNSQQQVGVIRQEVAFAIM